MSRVKKLIFSIFAAFIFVCFGFFAGAAGDFDADSLEDAKSGSSDAYVVKAYNIDVTYDEHNIVDVVEKYSVYFNEPRRGLTRKIPLVGAFLKPDGSSLNYTAKVYDVSVSEQYTMSKESGFCFLKIGDPDATVSGEKEYVVKYKYDIGRDRLSDMDQIYYSLVDAHEFPYQNVTFSVTLPKDFDSSELGFVVASKGSVGGMSKVKFNVEGTKITGSYDGTLASGETLVVRCVLPEGYFSRVHGGALIFQIVVTVVVVLVSLFVLITLLTDKKESGKSGRLVEPVEFYPPDGLNSVDVACIYKSGKINSKAVMSLIVYLAGRGYIKISNADGGSKNFVITKVKDYDGGNEIERKFFDGLFESGKDEVTHSDLYNKFYKTVDSIKVDVNSFSGDICKRIFSRNICFTLHFACVFSILTATFVVFATALDWLDIGRVIDGGVSGLGYINIGAIVSMVLAVVLAFVLIYRLCTKPIKCCSLTFLPWLISAYILFCDKTFLVVNCIGLGFHILIIFVFFIRGFPIYTEYGYETAGRVGGFRNFLLTAEKEKLEALVEDDPEYFYNILPYTYVFDISDKWIKKFESIAIEKPDWYDGVDAFDIYYLQRILHGITHHATDMDLSSTPLGSWASTISGWGSGSDGSGGAVGGGGYGGGSQDSW